jgi:hypothetical protein
MRPICYHRLVIVAVYPQNLLQPRSVQHSNGRAGERYTASVVCYSLAMQIGSKTSSIKIHRRTRQAWAGGGAFAPHDTAQATATIVGWNACIGQGS